MVSHKSDGHGMWGNNVQCDLGRERVNKKHLYNYSQVTHLPGVQGGGVMAGN